MALATFASGAIVFRTIQRPARSDRNCPAMQPISLTSEYLQRCRALLDMVERQSPAIQQAAGWFADTILAGRMVHLFRSEEHTSELQSH